eukprot:CAMPEP_0172696184 /NCGR_PEP_ID=MMETSP1074-20121228/27876_1 /TAXON_ID=2916 /ORGANISM="Ceratium fusus, Strain PA161109" /LENGTH=32 /DNA_ID= /DNA_START= /DNA_END= /DNA_ORIENTATION=
MATVTTRRRSWCTNSDEVSVLLTLVAAAASHR